MNNIQEYVDLLKAERQKAREESKHWKKTDKPSGSYYEGISIGLLLAIEKAELLLLNKPTVAITEAAHSANTVLSEVPTSESDTHIGGVGADSSETEIVKQNEQTKELCQCGEEMHDGCDCYENNECHFCGLPLH